MKFDSVRTECWKVHDAVIVKHVKIPLHQMILIACPAKCSFLGSARHIGVSRQQVLKICTEFLQSITQLINATQGASTMKTILAIFIISFGLAGCSAPKATGFRADPRAGADVSPYRTIPAAIQCDDCRLPAER